MADHPTPSRILGVDSKVFSFAFNYIFFYRIMSKTLKYNLYVLFCKDSVVSGSTGNLIFKTPRPPPPLTLHL